MLPPIVADAEQPQASDQISLLYGLADPTLFPSDDLAVAATAVLADDAAAALNYGNVYSGLLDHIIERLQRQGIHADYDNIFIGYGSNQILGLLPQVFVDVDDIVIIEGPSFLGAIKRFRLGGARLISIPVDHAGMNIDILEQTLIDLQQQNIRPRFIYTIPNYHNPTGVTMTLERRRKLVALAAEYGVVVVEDNAYGDLGFEDLTPTSLAVLDSERWVLHIGTFSKILAPGLRLGWACGHPDIIRRLIEFKPEGLTGPFISRVVARYCAEGRLDRHIERLVAHYRQKRDTMIDAIKRSFPIDVTVQTPEGGFFVWCKLPPDMRALKLAPIAAANGVTFLPGTECYADGQGDDAIRLAFSYQSSENIAQGIAKLGAAMDALRWR